MTGVKEWAKTRAPVPVVSLALRLVRLFRPSLAARTPLVMCTTEPAVEPVSLPEPYEFRILGGVTPPSGWIESLVSAGINVTSEVWTNDFARFPRARVIGISHHGHTIGTAGVTPLEPVEAGVGLLTWVGVHRDHQGRGLGKPLIMTTLRTAADSGMHTVLLVTDDHRLPAIRTYLAAGFRPCLNSWDWTHRPRWAEIGKALKLRAVTCTDTSHATWVSRLG